MATPREKYLAKKKDFNAKRPTIEITTPTGQIFKAIRLNALELMSLWDILGVDAEQVSNIGREKIGIRLMVKTRQLFDQFVCRFIVDPVLLPSTATKEELGMHPEAISVEDLAAADMEEILNKLLSSVRGAEGQALAEKFPEDAPGPADRPARKDL